MKEKSSTLLRAGYAVRYVFGSFVKVLQRHIVSHFYVIGPLVENCLIHNYITSVLRNDSQFHEVCLIAKYIIIFKGVSSIPSEGKNR